MSRTQDLRLLVESQPWERWPTLHCPACGEKTLALSEEPTVWEVASSVLSKGHEGWEPDWIHGTAIATLRCTRTECQEGVVATGPGRFTDNPKGRHRYGDYTVRLAPTHFQPPLIAIELPASTPQTVFDLVRDASAVIWSDPSAAVNRLRAAEEALLTAKGVRRIRVVNGKRRRLTLHGRLEEFEKKSPESAEFLMAVKWLGNDASHRDIITPIEAWEAMEMFELALQLVLDDRTAGLTRRAAKIIKQKGVGRR